MFETEFWPFVQAKHFGAKRTKEPRLITIHTPEWAELSDGAEKVADYFAHMSDGRVASAHVSVDNNTVVQSVKDSYVAFAAPGANNDGLHIELVGRANQTKEDWRDPFSLATLALGADVVAQYCLKYDLPAIKLTDSQLQQGNRGIVGHDQVSRVYKKSTHTDPGPHFPWGRFMQYVRGAIADRGAP